MLVGSASLTALWHQRVSPVITPILQLTSQTGQALVSITSSLLQMLASALGASAVAFGTHLWEWVGSPLRDAASAVWANVLYPVLHGACMGLSDLGESVWAALSAALAALWDAAWQWLLRPIGQALGGAIVALGLGLQAVGFWICSSLLSAAAVLLNLVWRYLLAPVVQILVSLVGKAAMVLGSVTGVVILAILGAHRLGLPVGAIVDQLTGRHREPVRYYRAL